MHMSMEREGKKVLGNTIEKRRMLTSDTASPQQSLKKVHLNGAESDHALLDVELEHYDSRQSIEKSVNTCDAYSGSQKQLEIGCFWPHAPWQELGMADAVHCKGNTKWSYQ